MKMLIVSILFLGAVMTGRTQQTNKESAVRFYLAINRNDASALESLVTSNFELYLASQKKSYKGPEFFRFVYETHQRVAHFRQDIKDVFGEGNWVCVTGVAIGSFTGQQRMEIEFTSVLEFDEQGRIKSQTIQDNRTIVNQQLAGTVKQ